MEFLSPNDGVKYFAFLGLEDHSVSVRIERNGLDVYTFFFGGIPEGMSEIFEVKCSNNTQTERAVRILMGDVSSSFVYRPLTRDPDATEDLVTLKRISSGESVMFRLEH